MVHKILQITDTHLDETPNTHGHNVYSKLSLVLQETVEKEDFDLIIFSGDISDTGCLTAYEWLKKTTQKYDHKIIWMPGNHDDLERMQKVFGFSFRVDIEQDKLTYQLSLNEINILCLDTSDKSLSARQIDWLINATDDNTFIFIHHPPMVCNSPFMDNKHCLQNWTVLTEKLLNIPEKTFRFFCGHYHQESYFAHYNIHIFLTPSTMFQIDRHKPYFEIYHTHSGYRVIEILQNNSFKTYCNYISTH